MTDEEHQVMQEIRAMAEESLKSTQRVETFFFGKGSADEKPAPHTRAAKLDRMIFGLEAGKLGYRIILGLAAFVIAIGGAYGAVKGWWSK